MAVHAMVRPALSSVPEVNLPELDEARVVFADAFLRGAAVPRKQRRRR